MHVTTITETIKVAVPPKAISGRNVAHGHRTPVERAFLVADLLARRPTPEDDGAALAWLAHASLPYVRPGSTVTAIHGFDHRLYDDISLLDAAATFVRPEKPVQPSHGGRIHRDVCSRRSGDARGMYACLQGRSARHRRCRNNAGAGAEWQRRLHHHPFSQLNLIAAPAKCGRPRTTESRNMSTPLVYYDGDLWASFLPMKRSPS